MSSHDEYLNYLVKNPEQKIDDHWQNYYTINERGKLIEFCIKSVKRSLNRIPKSLDNLEVLRKLLG